MNDSEAPEHDRRTVFVQGISFDMQAAQFEEAFSEIGPLRKCFLLHKKGQTRHKVVCAFPFLRKFPVGQQGTSMVDFSLIPAGVWLCAICLARGRSEGSKGVQ